jgi:hypothetical protein
MTQTLYAHMNIWIKKKKEKTSNHEKKSVVMTVGEKWNSFYSDVFFLTLFKQKAQS